MSPLAGFSDNPLESRDHVLNAVLALLQSLQRYQSPGGARIRIPVSTGAHFDETAAQLEGFARPLWAVAALLQGRLDGDGSLDALVSPFAQGLANGTNPNHPEYWGPISGTDQRMVEMEIISFALLAAPQTFYNGQNPETKANIITWLKSINDYRVDPTNWLFFRVMTNLALIECCGLSRGELWPQIEQDLTQLDSFYLSDGWSADGAWTDQRHQADYYSGSFAIQFSQLVYVRFAADLDPDRCSKFRERAQKFAADFLLYFDRDGAAIPFGRSLTYRFACAGFWAAAAYAEVRLPAPLDSPGAIKGLLLRHLRWWSTKHDIFNVDGTLSIGFAYPNMYMCEDYNSPQSVYWAMKSFIALALPPSHQFWTDQESTVPVDAIPLAKAVRAPHQILCNSGSHHFLLSSGQFCPWPLKATEAKYGKFAYSSRFGFSVPTGPLLAQMAPDSTLVLSMDGGASWKVRWMPISPRWSTALLRAGGETEELPVLISSWKPWPIFDIMVSTALIAPSSRWADWHIRIHRISASADNRIPSIAAVEGGFAIEGRKAVDGRPIPTSTQMNSQSLSFPKTAPLEAIMETSEGCCIFSKAGASGVRQLDVDTIADSTGFTQTQAQGSLLKPDSNTNLLCQRTVIPTVKSELALQQNAGAGEFLIAVGVFATTDTSPDTPARWADPPIVHIGAGSAPAAAAYIALSDW